MKIDSTQVSVNTDIQTVYGFLMNMENLIHILPKDNISDFTADTTSCSFKVQGGFSIPLTRTESTEFTEIKLKSGEKAPFPFHLTIHLTDKGTTTDGYIAFDGEVNMFLKMMVEKPLTNLFNYMSTKLQAYYAK